MAKPVPEGYHTLTPGLSVRGAAQAIDFYKRAKAWFAQMASSRK